MGDLAGSPPRSEEPTEPGLEVSRPRDEAELVALFAERAADYHARVQRVSEDRLRTAVATALADFGLARAVVAAGVPDLWLPENLDVIKGSTVTRAQLDEVDVAISGCAAAVAETGTIVLDGGSLSGCRAVTLVPDHHICIVKAPQIVGRLGNALARVRSAVDHGRGQSH